MSIFKALVPKMSLKRPLAIFIMGVSGVGKSTIGSLLAQQLTVPFFDGDDYHPETNITKMKAGSPLNDDDRHPWLTALNKLAKEQLQKNSCIIACSALKESYRTTLHKDIEANVKWVLLDGDYELIHKRLKKRSAHFMPDSLLRSQFDTLEDPIEALKIDITLRPEEIVRVIEEELFEKSEIGVIGMGVMGKSLARNLASNGFSISLFNRHLPGKEENIAAKAVQEFKELSDAKPFDSLQAFVNSLQRPKKLLVMISAGNAIDSIIHELVPLLSQNDVFIDGGNSHYDDTQRRIHLLSESDLHFIGAGISGGEEGALKGPSIMPSGNKEAYKLIRPFLESIAAIDQNNDPCCSYIGPDGSGHFVKMVHNGIEYAEMQLLAEVFEVFRRSGENNDEIATSLEAWKATVNSYLLEITIDILRKKEGNDWLLNKILDKSGNKGTGNWATMASSRLGVPSTMISAALFARYIASFKDERITTSELYATKIAPYRVDTDELRKAYEFARIINHVQGFKLLYEASKAYNWSLNLSDIARIWTNGCIIRSDLMETLVQVLQISKDILLEASFISKIKSLYPSTTKVVSECILHEVPIPCLSEALNYFNGYKTKNSSANLIQAQRDYFGAHTYQRLHDPSGKAYHTIWKNSSTHD